MTPPALAGCVKVHNSKVNEPDRQLARFLLHKR
jgi:hypothetical protein